MVESTGKKNLIEAEETVVEFTDTEKMLVDLIEAEIIIVKFSDIETNVGRFNRQRNKYDKIDGYKRKQLVKLMSIEQNY
jgi:hypothetical protein